jgi:hypothetical protein
MRRTFLEFTDWFLKDYTWGMRIGKLQNSYWKTDKPEGIKLGQDQ